MTFYIVDTTLGSSEFVTFSDYKSLVSYLETMCVRKFNQSRKQQMLMLESIGHGYDDSDSVTFVRFMASQFDMGIIRSNSSEHVKMKCDIPSIVLFQKDEFGN